MKTNILCSLLTCLVISCVASAQVTISGDTSYISGATFAGVGYLGEMDSTISSDTLASGARKNPNAVYALYEGQVYYQLTPIYCNNPTGTLTIVCIPDPKNPSAKTKPIILIQPTATAIEIGPALNIGGAVNEVYGSIKLVNIYYEAMEMDGSLPSELFYCGTANKLPQSLTIDNCLFEFCNLDLFDCTNETGAIGGWPYGAKFFITNSYFRNMFQPSQWWGSRVFQCRHPIDTLWVENCTVTTGGLTFWQTNELTDFGYFNHNTIINNMKYWLLSTYHRHFFVTNNIFINQSWVGEDSDVVESGQDPDKEFMSTINIDTVDAYHGVIVQPQYYAGDSSHYSPLLALNKMQVFVSNNIYYYDSLLINGYYNSSIYIDSAIGGLPAAPPWIAPFFYRVENIPCEWMNTRTKALFAAYAPPNAGFIEERTTTPSTCPISYGMSAAVVTAMAQWNQYRWGDPRFGAPTPALTTTAYIYGDYNPQTLPGIVNGAKTDAITFNVTILGPNDQLGISKFTDLTENFSQSAVLSTNDGFPVGSLIWDDAQNAAYATAHASELPKVLAAYFGGAPIDAVKPEPVVATVFNLAQNYPNPFNPVDSHQLSVTNEYSCDIESV